MVNGDYEHVKIKIVKNSNSKIIYVNPQRELNQNKNKTLFYNNLRGGNDKAIENILKKYPQIIDKLKEELKNDFSSKEYWESRYKTGRSSGVGSYNFFAEFKAETINDFISKNEIESVIEFGSGDGNQLSLSEYQNILALKLVKKCIKMFENDKIKNFVY